MKYINEKVAYTKGLVDGLELDQASNEGKVLVQVLDILEDIVDALDGITEAQEELEEYVEMVDDDLSDLEEFILDEDFSDDDEFEFDEEDYYEIICPECGNIYITEFEAFENNAVVCPDCGAPFKLNEEVASCCGEDGCDCHQEI
ncbi:CD1247 N-terminal domain-containing protein [Acetobacterium malicum]|uniref:Transcriptional regulator n=1 Tax=Acetobacterium malicum TaxID=52692 RepID=A0ABR6YZ00_9FIRM|nr:CD1247 N-terminal domain-containing protein [Acetobacterium malicum]MBC3900067.1 transcriptional regulator [Acetobacterium malicum]